jgi:hypothetical protein
MANHMETYINIKNGDIKVAEKLKEIFTPNEGEYETNTDAQQINIPAPDRVIDRT